MRESACLVFNPITVKNFASLFNCTPLGRASDSLMIQTYSCSFKLVLPEDWPIGVKLVIFFCFRFSVEIIKRLDRLRAKKTFIRKKLGHTAVSAINALSVTL